MIRAIQNILAVIMVITFAVPLAYLSLVAAKSAIMNSGTVLQVMSPDFDLERVMVEATK